MQERRTAVSQNHSVKYRFLGRRESTSVAKLLWAMLSWVRGNSRLCIWRRRTNISCVKGATCVVSRVRCLTVRCWIQQHRSPEVVSHSIVSGNIYCSPGAGPSVCRLCSWCLAVVYVELFNNHQVRRRLHRLATCSSEGSQSSASSISSEDLHLLKTSSVVRKPLNLLYYVLGV